MYRALGNCSKYRKSHINQKEWRRRIKIHGPNPVLREKGMAVTSTDYCTCPCRVAVQGHSHSATPVKPTSAAGSGNARPTAVTGPYRCRQKA
jgi:hypothetical protein